MKKQATHSNKRGINFLVDYLIFPIVTTFLVGPLSMFLILINFIILESLKGKTLGKYLTKTVVIKRDFGKPGFIRILIRTFTRFIPLDVLSYVFSLHPIGWHDVFSGTVVIDDSLYKNNSSTKVDETNQFIKTLQLAVISTDLFLKKYPELISILKRSKHPTNDWDFYMTVGGMGIYLNKEVNKKYEYSLKKELSTIDQQMLLALDDLNNFVKDKNTDFNVQVGFWILWNIGGESPTHKESERTAPAIGSYLNNIVKDFT